MSTNVRKSDKSIDASSMNYNSQIDLQPGDIVLDDRHPIGAMLVIEEAPLSADAHPDVNLNDTMNINRGVSECDRVYRCLKLPSGDEKVGVPSSEDVLDIPESVLTRYPIESAIEGADLPLSLHLLTTFVVDFRNSEVESVNFNDLLDAIVELEDHPGELIVEGVYSALAATRGT